ncbi:MAG: hypothetical protein ACOVQE_11215 [Chitinophagaceae bacterium]
MANSFRNKSAFRGPTPFKNSMGEANMLDDFSIVCFLNKQQLVAFSILNYNF